MVEFIAVMQETQTMNKWTSEGNLAVYVIRLLNTMQNKVRQTHFNNSGSVTSAKCLDWAKPYLSSQMSSVLINIHCLSWRAALILRDIFWAFVCIMFTLQRAEGSSLEFWQIQKWKEGNEILFLSSSYSDIQQQDEGSLICPHSTLSFY